MLRLPTMGNFSGFQAKFFGCVKEEVLKLTTTYQSAKR